MNCTEFNNYLTDGTDRELGASEQTVFDAHRTSCAACQDAYTSELALLEALRNLPVVGPPAGFADRVLTTAIQQNMTQKTNNHRLGFMVGFGSATAAALAMWVVVGMPPNALPMASNLTEQTIASVTTASTAKQPALSIMLNAKQTIKLAFASDEALSGAKITIRLPENVALVGYPGRRQLSWETSLKKGDNLLRLPVIATQVASGELIADIEYAGQVKTLRLNLETQAAGASLKQVVPGSVVG